MINLTPHPHSNITIEAIQQAAERHNLIDFTPYPLHAPSSSLEAHEAHEGGWGVFWGDCPRQTFNSLPRAIAHALRLRLNLPSVEAILMICLFEGCWEDGTADHPLLISWLGEWVG